MHDGDKKKKKNTNGNTEVTGLEGTELKSLSLQHSVDTLH